MTSPREQLIARFEKFAEQLTDGDFSGVGPYLDIEDVSLLLQSLKAQGEWVAVSDWPITVDQDVLVRIEFRYIGAPASDPPIVCHDVARWINHNGGGWTHYRNGKITHVRAIPATQSEPREGE